MLLVELLKHPVRVVLQEFNNSLHKESSSSSGERKRKVECKIQCQIFAPNWAAVYLEPRS